MSSLIEFRKDGAVARTSQKPERLSDGDADGAAVRLAEGTIGKKRGWPKGKPAGNRIRKTKLAVLGVPSAVLDTGNPAYARCVRLASAYRKVRVRELTISHGYVSSGASALLASAAHALAASRYLYEEAAKASGPDMLELLKLGAKLADSARANELAAWELTAREAVARRKADAVGQGMPWFVGDDGKKKMGRPRKDKDSEVFDVPRLPPVGTDLTVWAQDATVSEEVPDDTRAGSGTESQDGSGPGGSND